MLGDEVLSESISSGDIAVNRVDDVPERFHSRYNAKAKKYLYRIAIGDVPCVFDRKYTWYCFDKLDVTAMKKAAALLVGEHDFKAFCSNKRTNKSTVREIYDIDIYADTRELQITVYGNGFLYNMVRIIVGTLIEVGKGERRPEEMTAILEKQGQNKSRSNCGGTGIVPSGSGILDDHCELLVEYRKTSKSTRSWQAHSRCTVTGSGT